MTTIIKALMTENVRLSMSTRWLVFDEETEEWVVYEHKSYAKKVCEVTRTNYQEEAVAALLKETKE